MLLSRQVFPGSPVCCGQLVSRVAAPLGPVPAALIVVSSPERTASGTLDATTC